MTQKFQKGDLVHVAKDLGDLMSHFESDVDAIVMYSYKEKFGHGDSSSYCIHIKDQGEVAWYYEHQLILIAKDQLSLLETWEREQKEFTDKVSDIDWIFSNGLEVIKKPSGASMQAMATIMGMGDLWGKRGEGIDFIMNARVVLDFSKPFLLANDKAGWLAKIAEVQAKHVAKQRVGIIS